VAGVRQRVEQVVDRVRVLRAGRPTVVLVTDYWNVFEDGTRAVRDHGRAYLDLARAATDAADTAICAGARAGGATCVDLLGPFRTADGGVDDLLQDDGDHPDGDGHALIARTLAAAGLPALRR
jgi:lysophospholipase L1-like esterase